MTEDQWLAATNPYEIGMYARSPRQRHLFACACCRRVWRFVTDGRARAAFAVVERFIDGEASAEECDAAASVIFHGVSEGGDVGRSMELVRWTVNGSHPGRASRAARRAAWRVAAEADPGGRLTSRRPRSPAYEAALAAEFRAQADLLRDIVGSPFRPVAADPAWLTSTVVALAAAIYADRAFDGLPVLADALQDAGCEHPDVLGHCWGPGPHVRGCWVVDLLLGKG
jgi:hypothetical protein